MKASKAMVQWRTSPVPSTNGHRSFRAFCLALAMTMAALTGYTGTSHAGPIDCFDAFGRCFQSMDFAFTNSKSDRPGNFPDFIDLVLDKSEVLAFDRFDPNRGTLNSVQLSFTDSFMFYRGMGEVHEQELFSEVAGKITISDMFLLVEGVDRNLFELERADGVATCGPVSGGRISGSGTNIVNVPACEMAINGGTLQFSDLFHPQIDLTDLDFLSEFVIGGGR